MRKLSKYARILPGVDLMRGIEHISQISRQGWFANVHWEQAHFSSLTTCIDR